MATSQNNLEFYTAIFGANEVASALEKLIGTMDNMAGVADKASVSSDALSSSLSDISKTAKAAQDGLISAGSSGTEASVGFDEAAASADKAAGSMERASLAGESVSLGLRKGGLTAATADGYFGKLYKTLHTFERMGTPAILRATNWIGLGGAGIAYESVKSFMNYNNRVLQSITQAGVPLSKQSEIFNGILSISRETGQHANDIADAFYRVASSLSGAHTSMSTLLADTKAISEFNILGNIPQGASSEQSARVIMAAVNARLRGTTPGVNGIVGLMNAITGAGDIRAPDLISAFGRGGLAVAKVNNLTGADYGAAIDTLTKLGANGSAAGTSATRAIQMLFNQTSQGSKGYSMIGLDYNSLQKAEQKGGFGLVLQTLLDHLKKFDPFSNYPKFKGAEGTQGAINQMEQWFGNRLPQSFIKSWENQSLTPLQEQNILAMMLNKMFGGSRSSGTVAALMEFLPQYKSTRQEIIARSSPAYEQSMVKIAEQTPSRQMQRVQANIMADLINIGKKLTPIVLKLADALGGFLNMVKKNSYLLHLIVDVIGVVLTAGLAFRLAAVGKAAMQFAGGWNAGFEKLTSKFGLKETSPENWSKSRRLYEAKVNKEYVIFSEAVGEFSASTKTAVAENKNGTRNRSFISAVNKFARAVDLFSEGGGYGGGGGGGGSTRRRGSKSISQIESADSKMTEAYQLLKANEYGPNVPGLYGPVFSQPSSYQLTKLGEHGPNIPGLQGPQFGQVLTSYDSHQLAKMQSNLGAAGFILSETEKEDNWAKMQRPAAFSKTMASIEANSALQQSLIRLPRTGFVIPGAPINPATWDETNKLKAVEQMGSRAPIGTGIPSFGPDRPFEAFNPKAYPPLPFRDYTVGTSMVPYVPPKLEEGISTKGTFNEVSKSSKFLSKISGFFEGKGGKLFSGALGMLGGPVGMIASAALPMALPMIISGISKLTNWLSGHPVSIAAAPILTTNQALAKQAVIEARLQADYAKIAAGKDVVSTSKQIAALQGELGLVTAQAAPNYLKKAVTSQILGVTSVLGQSKYAPYYHGGFGISLPDSAMKTLKGIGGGVYAKYVSLLKSDGSGQASNNYLLNVLATDEKTVKGTPGLYKALIKGGGAGALAAAQINSDTNQLQLQKYKNLANANQTGATAAGSYVAMIGDIATLTAKKNADLANAAKYGLNTATGKSYTEDANNINKTIDDLKKSAEALTKKFNLSKESVDAIANGVASANEIVFAKIGLSKKDFTQAVSTGISNAASGVATIVNKVNTGSVR
jgi:hypothetical protein